MNDGQPRPNPADDTVGDRIARNTIATKRCTFVGAGLGALVLLVGSGDLLRDAPAVCVPLIVSLIFVGGGCLGLAYIPFLIASEMLSAKNAEVISRTGKPLELVPPYNFYAHGFYVASVWLLVAAAVAVLAAVWLQFALP